MITIQEKRSIETGGSFPSKGSFQILANDKAFRVIMSGIYSDKVRAVMSEISQNMRDSHILAGREDRPFEITMPTVYDPMIKFRDFGVSMTYEWIMNEYLLVFHSTKDKSNQFSGMLGIGRLASFSISDSYTLTSYLDGVENSFSIFLNENGLPDIVHLCSSPTYQENGICVEIPVKEHLIQEFIDKAPEVFHYYPVKPIFHNAEITIGEDKPLLESNVKKWAILGGNHAPKAIQVPYSYPINVNSLPGLSKEHTALLNSGVRLFFEMGELSPSTSRESLEYASTTIKNIKTALDQAQAELTEIIKEKLQGSNLFEKIKIAGDLLSYNGSLAGISNLSRAVLDKSDCPLEYDFSDWGCLIISRKGYNKMPVVNNLTTIAPGANLVFFYGGAKSSYAKLRGAKYLETNPHHNIIVLMAGAKTEQEFEDFYGVKMDSFPKFSDLPFTKPNTIKSRKEAGEFNVFQAGAYYAKEMWKKQKVDDDKEIYYVDRYAYTPYGDRKRLESETKSLSTLGCNDFVVVGLSDREINKLEESNDLDIKPFTDYYAAVIKEKREENKEILVENYYYQTNYLSFPTSILDKLDINESSLLAKIHKEYKKLSGRITKNSRITSILGSMKGNTDYKYSTELLKGHYPLLKCIDSYSLGKEASKDLSDYINSKNIDSLAEKE